MKYYLDKKVNSVFSVDGFDYECRENQDVEITKLEYQDFINSITNKKKLDKNYEINKLRKQRKTLLLAFDKYKTNVNYGIVVEDEETRSRIVAWYSDLLNLVESAFEEDNIPSEIKYYL